MKFFSLIVLTGLLVSCGGSSGGGSNGATAQNQESLEDAQGLYLASLRPLNTHLSGFIPSGQTEIVIKNNTFEVVSVLDDAASVTHRHNIHKGARCPDMRDDQNGDGYVDVNEALSVVGEIIIPLDSDLQTQTAGAFPRGSAMTYAKSTSIDLLMRDLREVDLDPSDHVVKLNDGEAFSLEGKVVLIHGASGFVNLPDSVATLPRETKQGSMPIACGILRKIQ